MNIGEKIKRLRAEKLMTQSQLAGTVITRNMLSCIENGSALPSLSTAKYLAQRLNVPLGYLLSDGEDEVLYNKNHMIADIKKAYCSGNLRICRDMCLNSGCDKDDEICLIIAECSFGIAVEDFECGMLRAACAGFDEAIDMTSHTIYSTEHILSSAAVYFRYMRRLSATLSSNLVDENNIETYSSMTNDFCRYALALDALDSGSVAEAESFAGSGEAEDPLVLHMGAKLDMKKGDYASAYDKMHRTLTNGLSVSEPVMYDMFCDLEVCCREIENFKGAYEYTNDKLELLQKMLT